MYLVTCIIHHRIDLITVHTYWYFLIIQRRKFPRHRAYRFHVMQVVFVDIITFATVGMTTELHTYQGHLLTGLQDGSKGYPHVGGERITLEIYHETRLDGFFLFSHDIQRTSAPCGATESEGGGGGGGGGGGKEEEQQEEQDKDEKMCQRVSYERMLREVVLWEGGVMRGE